MRPFELSTRAKTDLDEIHSWVFAQDRTTAALVVERIEDTIASVCQFPQIGKPTSTPDVWIFGGSGRSPFRITYRFDDDLVSVVRIFRTSRQNVQF